MKGIIVEIKNEDVVVLSKDGTICKMQNHDYKIGDEINMNEKQKAGPRFIRWGVSIAAACALFTIGAFAYSTPAGYVSLDVNPSVEYTINMFDRVIEVKAINDDGTELLTELNLMNKSIGKAIEQTTAKLIEEGYITDDENGGVIISTYGADTEDAQKLAEQLKERISAYIEEEGKIADVESEAIGEARVQEARELGVSPGKLNLIEKLIKSSTTSAAINKEEWLDKPVKEINKTIKENREALKGKAQVGEEDSEATREREEAGEEKGTPVRDREEKGDNNKIEKTQKQNDTDENDEDEMIDQKSEDDGRGEQAGQGLGGNKN